MTTQAAMPSLPIVACYPMAAGRVSCIRGLISGKRIRGERHRRKLRAKHVFVALAALWMTSAAAKTAAPAWSLLPLPAAMQPAGSGAVSIADGATVAVSGPRREQTLAIAQRFAGLVAATRGLHLHVDTAATARPRATIVFDLDPEADVVGEAGYRIAVGNGAIHVIARKPRGLFYGGVTVWQLLTPPGWKTGSAAKVADGTIDDHPRFAWRGLLLDSGRHFQSVADIEKLIDWMSLHKLNVLLWHLTEDQGWRLEVPKYPALTGIGACRKAVGLDAELTGSPDKPYCGFYTEAEVREIVRYAAARFVTIVPCVDVPGHSQAAVAAYPWLGVTGKRPEVWTDWGISPWLLKPDAKTLRFLDDVLDEVMQLFPSRYISIGGDEADKTQWKASPEVRARMQSLGLANMDALQGWFTARLADYLMHHGRTPVGWDDELLAGATLPASEVVMTWHGRDGLRVALQAIQQGHDVVLAPQESLYFDYYQSNLPEEWPGQPGVISLKDAYGTALVPQGATAAQEKHVVGVQGQLWAELVPNFARVEHALFPRMAALSELGWSPANTHDWNGFLARMPAEMARYRALGIGYADGAFAPAFSLATANGGKLRVTLSSQAGFGAIRYTTNGSAPTAGSARYAAPLEFPADARTMLRAATFAPDGFELSEPRSQVVDLVALLTRDGAQLATCSGNPPMRLAGHRPAHGRPPVYAVDVGNMCWLWKDAPLDGVRQISMTVGRIPWRFGDDSAGATARPARSTAGEFEVHADSCKGPLLATLPLARAAAAQYQTTLTAHMASAGAAGNGTMCIIATGDPRDGQWAIANVSLSK
ncbi:MAG TPA: family 20 glycosylhydrolase [Rhodanobacteraceae bacterium]|nr:family 20 glycosylhydrolase [Rhodanobacteraceae bacterium]